MGGCKLDSFGSEWGPLPELCEHGNDLDFLSGAENILSR